MRAIFAAIPAVAAAVVLLVAAASVDGQPRRPRPPVAPSASHDIDVMVGGSARARWDLGGQRWIEGRLGERYSIRIYNRSARRVEAVASVDGRDAIDGGPASLSKRGYVIEPWGHVDLDGFRLSMQDVAAFRFTTVPDAYASRMGASWAVGNIAVSFFPERYVPPLPRATPYARRDGSAAESRSADRAAPRGAEQGLGTQFGERRWSPVRETSFVRHDPWNPSQRVVLRYDDRAGLCRRGIESMCDGRPRPPPICRDCTPWPEERRFATPPPGWYED